MLQEVCVPEINFLQFRAVVVSGLCEWVLIETLTAMVLRQTGYDTQRFLLFAGQTTVRCSTPRVAITAGRRVDNSHWQANA